MCPFKFQRLQMCRVLVARRFVDFRTEDVSLSPSCSLQLEVWLQLGGIFRNIKYITIVVYVEYVDRSALWSFENSYLKNTFKDRLFVLIDKVLSIHYSVQPKDALSVVSRIAFTGFSYTYRRKKKRLLFKD